MTTPDDEESARKLAEELWKEEARKKGSADDDK
jgi:hypothetical protein